MAWGDTLVGAAAALVGGGIGAWASLKTTQKSLDSENDLQKVKMAEDKDLAREEREYGQRREAYAPMMKYLSWAIYVNRARTTVAQRRFDAVNAVQLMNVQDVTEEAVAKMQKAYDDSGPTPIEEEVLNAAPPADERFTTLGLVTAFGSEDVVSGFWRVISSTESVDEARIR